MIKFARKKIAPAKNKLVLTSMITEPTSNLIK